MEKAKTALGHSSETAKLGYDYDCLLGHFRAIIDHEIESASGRRLVYAQRAEKAILELEQISIDMGLCT
jgi:hypothetical protein